MSDVSLVGLKMLIDNLDEGVLFLDANRHVVAINKAALKMIEHNKEKNVLDELCFNLFPGAECATSCEESGKCSLVNIADKKEGSILLTRKDGEMAFLRIWAIKLPTSESLAYYAVVLRDHTREWQLEKEVSSRLHLGKLLGHSQVMQELFQVILRVSASDASVLIEGESGVGKELVAQALHENSKRAKGPYVRVHCAALAENLLESELFGHAKGAFTGADAARAGRFEIANGGTILLDEIGEISPTIQVKLLRVLQEREVERIGENKPRKVDVRIIAATNRDLSQMVKAGEFREDLFYRLRVLPMHVPTLRARVSDLPMLANHIVDDISRRYEREGVRISQAAFRVLEAYNWPGNVRELVNAMEFAFVQLDGTVILPRHLPHDIMGASDARFSPPETEHASPPDVGYTGGFKPYYRAEMQKDEEKQMIMNALKDTDGNRAAAARKLGMSRTTMWKRMKHYGLA